MKFICTLISIATAALVLVSLCASPLSVSAAQGSNANVQALAVVGASAGSAPAACAPDANSLALLVQGANGALWYDHWDGTNGWSPTWTSLGGVLTSSPAATSLGSGLIDVFARGSDGAIWERTTTNGGSSWSAWSGIGGQLASGTGPAVCSQGSRLDVFVQGTNGALYQKTWNGTSWSSWQNLGGSLTSSPAAATAPGSSRIDVFVLGTDNGLWQKTYSGGWSLWKSVGGVTETIYYVPQAGSTWVNQGTAGASYNAYVSTPAYFRPNQTATRIGVPSGKMILSASRRAAQQTTRTSFRGR